ncbi:MAG: type II secretion system secretin GspD [Rhodospirillaceae bacterium]|nr:type II secretion system secretin GspD [Rhodospirillaceae bacterium]
MKVPNRVGACVLSMLLLASCERVLSDGLTQDIPAISDALSEEPEAKATETRRDSLIDDKGRPARAPVDEVYLGKKTAGSAAKPVTSVDLDGGELTVNFAETDLRQVLKVVLGDLLRLNYVLPPVLQGKVTLRTVRPVTRRQMMLALDKVLGAHGLAITYGADDTASVAARTQAVRTAFTGNSDGFAIDVVPLRHVGSTQMAKLLAPVLPEGQIIAVETMADLLLVSGSAEERQAATRAVDLFDVDRMATQSVAIIGLDKADPETLIGELHEIFGDGAKGALGGLVRFVVIKRMSAVLAIARSENYLDQARVWIKRLDRSQAHSQRRLFVYFVKHGTASGLIKTLRGAFSGEEALTKTAAKAGENVQDKPVSTRPRFMPDEAGNAILIWATGDEYDLISEVLAKLDIRPLQVLIEGTVIEITLRDQLRYGLQYFIEAGDLTALFTRGLSASTVTPLTPGFGLTIEGSNDSRAVIDALSELTDVRVVSSPQILVVDGGTARLHVGDQIPVVTRTSSATSSDDTRIVNEVVYRDTGVTLEVSPRVKASGLVSLDLIQEVSDVVTTDSSEIDSPTIQQRRVKSTAAVQSGTTMLMAGMIRERQSEGESGLPGLRSLPVVGKLFGTTDSDRRRTELLVLITPRVIENSRDAADTTKQMLRRYRGIIESLTAPEGGKKE